MEADWEVEVGGGAPVIEALWPGFVDLCRNPERVEEVEEAARFPALAGLLLALNGPRSLLWTAKSDLWEPEAAKMAGSESADALACYIDLLPREGRVFAQWQQAEAFCREWVSRLAPIPLRECRVELVVRQANADEAEGFGITAYLSATGRRGDGGRAAAADALAAAMAAFASAIPKLPAPEWPASKLQ
jgi:hypothetical protein